MHLIDNFCERIISDGSIDHMEKIRALVHFHRSNHCDSLAPDYIRSVLHVYMLDIHDEIHRLATISGSDAKIFASISASEVKERSAETEDISVDGQIADLLDDLVKAALEINGRIPPDSRSGVVKT